MNIPNTIAVKARRCRGSMRSEAGAAGIGGAAALVGATDPEGGRSERWAMARLVMTCPLWF